MTDSFEAWRSTRQDVKTWNEDDIAVARLVWAEAWKIAHQDLGKLREKIKELEEKQCSSADGVNANAVAGAISTSEP